MCSPVLGIQQSRIQQSTSPRSQAGGLGFTSDQGQHKQCKEKQRRQVTQRAAHSESGGAPYPPSSLPSTSKATAGLRLGPTSPQPRGGTSVGKAGRPLPSSPGFLASFCRGERNCRVGNGQTAVRRRPGPCLEEHVNVALAEGGMASQPR